MSNTKRRDHSPDSPNFAGEEPSTSQPASSPPRARRFGDYLLVEQLGLGGMGEVWLAKQLGGLAGIDKFCVVKTIRPTLAGDVEYQSRFLDEARTVVQLTHRNICQVFDVGQVGDDFFFAMELVPGFDFRRIFLQARADGVAVDEPVALHLTAEILEALDYAHRLVDVSTGDPLHLIHRDVSQQNALVSLEGEVKLIDFGLAKSKLKTARTEVGIVHGKMAYMAPEQARGEHMDARADQFSAAVVGYELLAGERFYGDMAVGDISRVMVTDGYRPPRLDAFTEPIRTIFARALEHDRTKRWPSCAAMRKALVSAAAARGAIAGSEDVRALIDRLFPRARDENRARMVQASAAAKAVGAPGVIVQFEKAVRIATSPSMPLPVSSSSPSASQIASQAALDRARTLVNIEGGPVQLSPVTDIDLAPVTNAGDARDPTTDQGDSLPRDTEEGGPLITPGAFTPPFRPAADTMVDFDPPATTPPKRVNKTDPTELVHRPVRALDSSSDSIAVVEASSSSPPSSSRAPLLLIGLVVAAVAAAGAYAAKSGLFSSPPAPPPIATTSMTPPSTNANVEASPPTATAPTTATALTTTAATTPATAPTTPTTAPPPTPPTPGSTTAPTTATPTATTPPTTTATPATATATTPPTPTTTPPTAPVLAVEPIVAKETRSTGERRTSTTHRKDPIARAKPEKPEKPEEPEKPKRPPLPATPPSSAFTLVGVVEASCVDVVPCASGLKRRLNEANQGTLDDVKAVKTQAEQCYAECKRKLP